MPQRAVSLWFALILVLTGLLTGCPGADPRNNDAGLPDGGSEPDSGPEGLDGGDGGEPDGGPVDAGPDFVPVSVAAAVTKVKNVLVGLPPTEEEVQAVATDRAALKGLVTQWMGLPQYNAKMLGFFTTQFQQDGWEFADLTFQFHGQMPFSYDSRRIVQNLQQSFGRTVLQLISEGQPFTSALTTKRYMMTPALMAMYATVDVSHVDDSYNLTDLFQRDHPSQVTVQSATTIPLSESLDPLSPNYLSFNAPSIVTPYSMDCPYGTLVYPSPAEFASITGLLYSYQPWPVNDFQCFPPVVPQGGRYVQDSDFSDWRMVSVRQPRTGESTTQFYDLPYFRSGSELVLRTPRVGFFTTPAFAARWLSNDSNQHRVVANQTLIVALGAPITLTNTTVPRNLEAVDAQHAPAGTTCYSCHQSLDPMRQFFHQNYSYYFGTQDNPTARAMTGQFAFHDVIGSGNSIDDLGRLLASHPMFATAWVQKLCTYATSATCDESDPEFVRLVNAFVDSHYSWNTLVQELFASPLVTYLERTEAVALSGQVFPVARRDHLCATLSVRLGVQDICSLDVNTATPSQVLRTLAGSWPSDQYSRGSEVPSMAVNPSPMIRGGMENLCADLAMKLVDDGQSGFSSADPTAAVQALATKLMGLTSERIAGPSGILLEHYNAAIESGTIPRIAMRSTFVLACLSPYVVGVGQ